MEDLQPGDILITNINYEACDIYHFYKRGEPYIFIGYEAINRFKVIDSAGDPRTIRKELLAKLPVKDPINLLKEIISNILDK